ncbi:MAG: ATP-binding protein [Jaaginema sp. PMC 1079.18]|nr:ATP-binding protein [Jaaginema sp. PMC 1080.18]MEC4849965.1 ATP-binding protein [Jaaginema sp. PMC 1079.18]MEC4866940.1 ATP-binding protein [Jaaginema sp. PMC 1078.18]
MTQIFGDYLTNLSESQEYLIIGFSPSSIPLKQRWRNNGLSADFLADYFATFFPSSENNEFGLERQNEIKSAIAYIANELIENAMKFNDPHTNIPIDIALHLGSDLIVFMITNSVVPEKVPAFQEYIKKIVAGDPADLYIEQLEKNAESEQSDASRLGYLTILNDYETKLGWKFETRSQHPIVVTITSMVQLSV